MKLNIGCGTDYREGFINIDGSDELQKVDKVIDISNQPLTDHFDQESIQFILANDILEHHFHWQAQRILREFYRLLAPGGEIEVRVPDTEFIIKSWRIPLQQKIVLLYGGQDISQGTDAEMDKSRKFFPQFFCHKYGWTRDSMTAELEDIGFKRVSTKRAHTNFIATATR
jgi:SAM-dependent methyltransferase